jgi:hypothetical protein
MIVEIQKKKEEDDRRRMMERESKMLKEREIKEGRQALK